MRRPAAGAACESRSAGSWPPIAGGSPRPYLARGRSCARTGSVGLAARAACVRKAHTALHPPIRGFRWAYTLVEIETAASRRLRDLAADRKRHGRLPTTTPAAGSKRCASTAPTTVVYSSGSGTRVSLRAQRAFVGYRLEKRCCVLSGRFGPDDAIGRCSRQWNVRARRWAQVGAVGPAKASARVLSDGLAPPCIGRRGDSRLTKFA